MLHCLCFTSQERDVPIRGNSAQNHIPHTHTTSDGLVTHDHIHGICFVSFTTRRQEVFYPFDVLKRFLARILRKYV
jgi:hypothetical protein